MTDNRTLTRTVVTALREIGEASAAELAEVLFMDADRISDLLRNSFRQGYWGAFVVRTERGPGIRGMGRNIWAVDEAKYRESLAKAEDKLKPKPVKVAANHDYIRTYVWPGQILTRWQASSPYHLEAA